MQQLQKLHASFLLTSHNDVPVDRTEPMKKRLFSLTIVVGVLLLAAVGFLTSWFGFFTTKSSGHASKADFLAVLSTDQATVDRGLASIESNWDIANIVMLVEVAQQAPTWQAKDKAITLLTEKTGQQFGYDYNGWVGLRGSGIKTMTRTQIMLSSKPICIRPSIHGLSNISMMPAKRRFAWMKFVGAPCCVTAYRR